MKLKMLLIAALCTAALSACANQGTSASGDATAKAAETVTAAADKTAAVTENSAEETEESSARSADSAKSGEAEKEKQGGTETSAVSEVDLETLLDLMGKKDSEVVSALGEGEPMDNDGVIINRDYAWKLFGEDVSATMYFNLYQEGKDLLEQCTINLSGSDLEAYAATLEKTLGKPAETYEKSYFYTTDACSVVLANPYDDAPYIEISLNSSEN